jgi:hypothetical protein
VAGWAYQLVAELGFERDSWMAAIDARRVAPEEDANDVAAEQIRALVGRLARRNAGGSDALLFVFDAGYDPVRLQQNLEGQSAQILVRLHSSRVFYADPPTLECRPVGWPFVQGKKFDLKDPASWHEPSAEHFSEDAGYGKVRVRAWSGLHPKTRKAGERYGSGSAAVVRDTVVLVEVQRLPRGERRRKPKKLWLWWHGEGKPNLELLWRSYVRRFDLEHTIKFFKGTLGWTTSRVRHPEQADLWTWLILAAYAQLQLARGVVADRWLTFLRKIIFVGDRFQPVGGAVSVQRRVDGDVDHEGVGGCAVPVFLAGGYVDDVAGSNLQGSFAFFLDAAHAGYDVEDLSFRMGVPVGPRPRLEEYPKQSRSRLRDRGSVHPDGPGEPLFRGAAGFGVSGRNDFHGSLLNGRLLARNRLLGRDGTRRSSAV